MSTNPLAHTESTRDTFLLRLHLSAMVPLAIMELQARGGPNEEDYSRLHTYVNHFNEVGESLFYKIKGQTATSMNYLVEAIAVLAFSPGGITVFDLSFNASGIPASDTAQAPLAKHFIDQLEKSTKEITQ